MYGSIHAVKHGFLTGDMRRNGKVETHVSLDALKYSKMQLSIK